MMDWPRIEQRLTRLARDAAPGGMLTVIVPLPQPVEGLPDQGEWCHWRRPDRGLTLTGLGAALRVETEGAGRFAALDAALRGLRAHWRVDGGDDRNQVGSVAPPLTFCGFAFAPTGGAPWPNASLRVPAVLLRDTDGRADIAFSCAAANAANAEAVVARWRSLLASVKVSRGETPHDRPPRLARVPAPLADLAFLARGSAALAAIAAGHCAKLVLTRSARLIAGRAMPPGRAIVALADRNPNCAIWAWARDDRVFLGASPERLLACQRGRVEVDALAGTTWLPHAGDRAPSPSLADDKNRREHDLVAASVREALAPLCDEVSVPAQPEIMRLGELSHLRRRIVGRARPDVSAFDLIARLHPTPAVGGTPTAAALDWLAGHGDRRDAWYTGGIGWADAAGDADFAVALRCGLLAGREATLYAGAGFVAGSDPRQELAETEAKLSPMLAALRAAPAVRNKARA